MLYNQITNMSITKILLVALLCLAFSYNVQAECCPRDKNGWCKDRTKGTPCCGYGPCNIFCCNCDGGCRKPIQREYQSTKSYSKEAFGFYLEGKGITDSQVLDHLFKQLDANKDGKIDQKEVSNGKNTPIEQLTAKFANSDL